MVEGVPHFSITGATKTLYGNTGGESLRSLRAQLVKTSGHQNPVTAAELSGLPGISPVTIEADGTQTGRVREAFAITQDTFESLLFEYWQKDTKAGRYMYLPVLQSTREPIHNHRIGALDRNALSHAQEPQEGMLMNNWAAFLGKELKGITGDSGRA